jgi:penicillin G amidase
VFAIDANDLYVYDLDPTNQSYCYDDGWEEFETLSEEIDVRGEDSETVELQFTRHGPVIYIDEEDHKAYAVRSVWFEPGTSAYFGSVDYMQANNWDEFLDAMARWGTPGENQVYADVDGNIGWKPGGRAPVRVGYDGLLPVPGDGRYEWDGFRAGSEFPEVFNPPEGFFATANQFNAQEDSSFAYEWSSPIRHDRLVEVLSGQNRHSLEDSARLQTDIVNPRAREIVDMVRPLDSDDPLTAEALAFITEYEEVESIGSPHARLYRSYWESEVNAAVKAELVSPDDAQLFGSVDWLVVMDSLRNPEDWFDGGEDTRNELLLASLRAAYAEAQEDLGPDSSTWEYLGNSRSMNHPLGGFEPSFNVGPFQIPGSSGTPIASGNASYRQILDVGRWDRSLAINTPGQSGVPTSPHYRDLGATWEAGEYFPLLFTRGAINRRTESRHVLVPARS